MTSLSLGIRYARGGVRLEDCVSVRFEKERYTPYTSLSGEWLCPQNVSMAEVYSLMFYADNVLLHYGPPDLVEFYKKDGMTAIKVKSRGFSQGLPQNQCPDGLITDINLTSLVAASGVTLPNVTYQPNTPTVNYVNYYEGTDLWSAIVSYSLRASGSYPYIYGPNAVRIAKSGSERVYETSSLFMTRRAVSCDFSKIISKIHMRPIDGEGEGYSAQNPNAARRSIVRCREIPFDREWIMDPDAGLQSRLDYSRRAINSDSFTLPGYVPLDLLDTVSVTDLNYSAEVSRIVLSGTALTGLSTELTCYHDAYCA